MASSASTSSLSHLYGIWSSSLLFSDKESSMTQSVCYNPADLIILISLDKFQWSILLLLVLLFGESSRKKADKEWKLARQFLSFWLPGPKTEKEVPAVWFNKNQCLAQASIIVRPVRLNWHKRSVSERLHFISARKFKLPCAFSERHKIALLCCRSSRLIHIICIFYVRA